MNKNEMESRERNAFIQLLIRGLGAYEIEARSPRLWPVKGVPHHAFSTNAVSHNLTCVIIKLVPW